jgi:hypothetical protein
MPKKITSPSKIWPGHVLLCDPLTISQVNDMELTFDKLPKIDPKDKKFIWLAKHDLIVLPTIIPCVAEWHLDNFPEKVDFESFPGSPRIESSKLILWLWHELWSIYSAEVTIPNA